MPSGPGQPSSVPLIVRDERWDGYVFWLSYIDAELTGVEIRREHEAATLTAQALQRVPLGALDRVARRCVDDFLSEWYRLGNEPSPVLESMDAAADTSGERDNDKLLAELCARYLELNGEPGWRATLAHEFPYSLSSIQTVIARARRRRFLTSVPRGKSGGRLTPKALRLLPRPTPDPAEVKQFLFGDGPVDPDAFQREEEDA